MPLASLIYIHSVLIISKDLPRANHPEDVMEWAEGDLGIPHIHAVKLFDNDIDMEELQQWSEDLDKAEEEMVRLCNMPPRWAEKVSKGIPLLIPAAGEFYPVGLLFIR